MSRDPDPDVAASARADLRGVPFPVGTEYAREQFQRLNKRRRRGVDGPDPLTWADLVTYQALTGESFTPLDVLLIEAADDAMMAHVAESARASRDTSRARGDE